jgi:hypothetical protein
MTITDPTDPDYDYEADATAADAEHVFDPATAIRATPRRGEPPMSAMSVRISGADIARLGRVADAQGVGLTQLARQWILQRLDAEAPPPASPAATLEKAIAELSQVLASLR